MFKKENLILNIKSNEQLLKSKDLDINKLKVKFADLKRRNVYVVINGEEVFIKLIRLPRMNEEYIYDGVKNELRYILKNIDSIMFTYSIFKEYKTSFDVLVFCINSEKIVGLKENITKFSNVKGIYLIQFLTINYFKENIKENNFTFILTFGDFTYFVLCIDKKVIYNKTVNNEDMSKDEFIKNFKYIEDKFKEINQSFNTIYISNFKNDSLIKLISERYKCVMLGNIDISKIGSVFK